RPRVVRLVVAEQPVDHRLPKRARCTAGGPGRLVVRLVPAGTPGGIRRCGWLRSGLLHVLRGRCPRRAAEPSRLAERLHPIGGGHPRRGPRDGPGTPPDGHGAPSPRLEGGAGGTFLTRGGRR